MLTDGPLCTIALDGEGRLGPASAGGRWLDAQPGWRDADGTIGGSGVLDGGRTCLVVVPGGEPWLRTRWLRSATPGAGPLTQLRIDRITASGRDTFAVPTGAEGANDTRPLPVAIDRVCALVATARDPVVGERCITNPVWVVPVRVAIDAPARAASRTGTALPAGALRVTFRFPISMSADAGSRARLVPLDADGRDAGPAIALRPAPGWEDEDGVAHARLTLVNGDDVPLPAGEWDADAHARAPGARSFAVVLERPTDVHGNALNDIGRTFVLRLPAADGAGAP